jgi:hypothetical protein
MTFMNVYPIIGIKIISLGDYFECNRSFCQDDVIYCNWLQKIMDEKSMILQWPKILIRNKK